MSVSYKKLWKLLIDKDMKKKRPVREGWYQPSIRHQNGTERTCHYRNTRKDLRSAGLPDRGYRGDRAGS